MRNGKMLRTMLGVLGGFIGFALLMTAQTAVVLGLAELLSWLGSLTGISL